jgi:hypothetical protein
MKVEDHAGTTVVVSFKLRPVDDHVRVVRRDAETGRTLRGPEAARAFALGRALFERVSRGAPERVRALSLDLGRARLTATLERADGGKPDVVRLDGPEVLELIEPALLDHLAAATA